MHDVNAQLKYKMVFGSALPLIALHGWLEYFKAAGLKLEAHDLILKEMGSAPSTLLPRPNQCHKARSRRGAATRMCQRGEALITAGSGRAASKLMCDRGGPGVFTCMRRVPAHARARPM